MSIALARADQPRQPHGAAVDQRHAPAAAEHAEHRVLLGDPQVAPQRELETAGDRVAGDRGDHRLREPHPARAHRAVAVALDAVAPRPARLLQVGARAEDAALAVEHRDGGVLVGVEVAERLGQSGRGRAVDRVAPLGAREQHRRDRVRRARSGPLRSCCLRPHVGRTSAAPRGSSRPTACRRPAATAARRAPRRILRRAPRRSARRSGRAARRRRSRTCSACAVSSR